MNAIEDLTVSGVLMAEALKRVADAMRHFGALVSEAAVMKTTDRRIARKLARRYDVRFTTNRAGKPRTYSPCA